MGWLVGAATGICLPTAKHSKVMLYQEPSEGMGVPWPLGVLPSPETLHLVLSELLT